MVNVRRVGLLRSALCCFGAAVEASEPFLDLELSPLLRGLYTELPTISLPGIRGSWDS